MLKYPVTGSGKSDAHCISCEFSWRRLLKHIALYLHHCQLMA